MSQVVPCPACGQHLKLPDALLGKSVRCKCAHVFTAPLPTTACPVCGAGMPEDATSCPDCGYRLTGSPGPTKVETDDKLNVCPNSACGALNPPGERLCQRCNTPLPGAIGQVVAGKYRIEEALATGGFGVVYRAADTATGEPVAVKEMIATDPREFRLRRTFFRREAEILRAIQHVPIVPRLFDFVEDGTAAYLVLEFIPGSNLLALLDRPGAKPFPVPKVAAWGGKICEALAHMHRMTPPVVHRDMKPENVMLLPDGETIRLIDFGTARDMGTGAKERGVAKTKVYTEGYAPPEQVIGKPEPRSDLFALAGTLYHLATGQAPEGFFTGREVARNLANHPSDERWFWELVAINLSEDVNDRYLSARDLKGDLERGAVTGEVYCSKCGTGTPAREPYCRGCAAAMAPAGGPCPRCERPTLLGCRFCVTCGTRL
jgi:eukaryotic-like serine/threonine-protein kinase